MRQKKKLLFAGILCCMCLGTVCVSIGVRGRFPRKLPKIQIEEQKTEGKTSREQENREEKKKEEVSPAQTESRTEQNIPELPVPKTGDTWWK